VGSALTETKHWDLLVDCTSRDVLETIESVVSSTFAKAEADSV
jgi:hypothetical protein